MSRFTQLLKEPDAPIQTPAPVAIKTAPVVKKEAAAPPPKSRTFSTRLKVHKKFLEEVELSALEALPDARMRAEVVSFVEEFIENERMQLNAAEVNGLVDDILNELKGLGPLEPLMNDPTVSDILINGHENC
ncbi:MAG: CpaF family protein, partial [Pseudomonadota bacterium]